MHKDDPDNVLRITAVLPAYNVEKHICRSIDSVLNQTHPPDEIIVVDDGSSDKTVQVVRSYGEKVKLIQQQNAGASAARNAGIEAATGNWIAFLDADDEWLPHMLQRQVDIVLNNPHLVWTSGNFKVCFCQRQEQRIKDAPERIEALLNGRNYFDDYLETFTQRIRGWTSCMLIRKDVLQEVGLFCTDLPKANDLDMWFRIAYRYPEIGYVAEPLAVYHMQAGQCLSMRPMMFDYLQHFLQRHLDLAKVADRLEAFTPCAEQMLRAWIRSSLFDDRVYDISKAIEVFDSLLSAKYKRTVRMMTVLPGLTKQMFQTLSWLSRTFKLRRQTWHPKERYKRP